MSTAAPVPDSLGRLAERPTTSRRLGDPTRSREVWTLSALKFVNDAYISFPTALLPVLVPRFALSLTAVGVLTALLSISSMLVQPLFGYLADRWRTRLFVVACPAITVITMTFVFAAPSYVVVLLLVIFGGLGTAAFNPQAAVLARSYSGARPGVGLAMLTSGGQFGRAAGPVLITLLVSALAAEAVVPAALLPLPLVFLAFLVIPRASPLLSTGPVRVAGAVRRRAGYVAILCGLVALRALTLATFGAFLPLFLSQIGFSLPAIGVTLSLLQLSGALGGLLGGFLAHRIGYRPVILMGLVGPVIPLLFATTTSGPLLITAVFLGGLILMLSVAVNVSFALDVWPSRAALISGIMIGVGWGLGGALAAGFGVIADAIGLANSLRLASATLLVGVPFALLLPDHVGSRIATTPT